jgi:hypothetical protein
VSDNTSVIKWHQVFDFKNQGTIEFDQLSLQRWKNGKIYHKRHHSLLMDNVTRIRKIRTPGISSNLCLNQIK